MGKDLNQYGLPRIGRDIKPGVRAAVIDAARDGYGRVICEHCSKQITDDQQITLNHKFQWQDLQAQFGNDAKFTVLPEEYQRKFLRKIFNDALNLQPLHVACHREVDFGIKYTAEEEERINRRHAAKPPESMRDTPEAMVYNPAAYQQQRPVPPKPASPTMSLGPPFPSPSVKNHPVMKPYGWLVATTVVKPEDRVALEELPLGALIYYRDLTAERLKHTDEKIEFVRAEPGKVYSNKTEVLERLAKRRDGLDSQLTFLTRLQERDASSPGSSR